MAIKFTEEYLTTAQAAAELELETDTVKRYCNAKPQLIAGEKIGNNWMIPRSAIEEYLKKEKDPRGRPRKSAC